MSKVMKTSDLLGPKCLESHPELEIGGGKLYGGSCSRPVVLDADVYIGLDRGMQITTRRWPWSPGEEILFPVTDGDVPDIGDFRKLVSWTTEQLKKGLRVHVGCIGGHGRTGTLIAALVAEIDGDEDAIKTVRKEYCSRAVESRKQVDFLVKHFGVKTAKARREFLPSTTGSLSKWDKMYPGVSGVAKKGNSRSLASAPIESPVCLWGTDNWPHGEEGY